MLASPGGADSFFFFSSRRRHTRLQGDWSSDVCSSDLDRGEDVLPAGPARALAAVAGDAMAAGADAPELLDVDVHELARAGALVADDLRTRQGRPQSRGAMAAQDRVHGRGGQAERPAELVRAEAQLAAGAQDRLLESRRRAPGRAMRTARAVAEPLAVAVTADPLRSGLARAADHERGRRDRHARAHQSDQALSLPPAERGISMKNHRALLWLRLRQAAP